MLTQSSEKKLLSPLVVSLGLAALLAGCGAKTNTAPAPAEPAVVIVEPADSDNDGVIDANDECPKTRAGAVVDARGCEIIVSLPSTHFDFDKAALKADAIPALTEAAQAIAARSADKIEIAGYTDSTGSESYNQKLGYDRASAVLEFFIEQGLNPASFSIVSYGEANPVASNDTAEGRAENRRVEIVDLSQ